MYVHVSVHTWTVSLCMSVLCRCVCLDCVAVLYVDCVARNRADGAGHVPTARVRRRVRVGGQVRRIWLRNLRVSGCQCRLLSGA